MVIERIHSLLFGNRRRIGVTIVCSIVLLVALAFAAGLVGLPSVEETDSEFGTVNESHTEVRTAVTVNNPNLVSASRTDPALEYAFTMNDIEMGQGEARNLDLDPGRSTETVTTVVRNDRIPQWWVTHLENDERTELVLDSTLYTGVGWETHRTDVRCLETDLLAPLTTEETQPVNVDQPLVSDPVLTVNETRAEWGDVDDDHTTLEVSGVVYNPQAIDIPTAPLEYTVSMNDVVVGEGEYDDGEDEYLLESEAETEIETSVRIDNDRLEEWWITHVERDQNSTLQIEFEIGAEIEALDTTVAVPFEVYEGTLETDLLAQDDAAEGTVEEGPC